MEKGLDFEIAVKNTLSETEGSFAIVGVDLESNQISGARSASPLVMGIGKEEYFLASDVPAFLEHTNRVIYLEDDELVVINEEMKFDNLRIEKPVKKEVKSVGWSIEQARKGILCSKR